VDFFSLFVMDFIQQLRSPTLAFLIGGMIIAALGSELVIPESICTIIVFMLLTKIGLTGGIAIRNSNLTEMVLPMIFAVIVGIFVVFIARYTLANLPKVKVVDAIATGGVIWSREWLDYGRRSDGTRRTKDPLRGLGRRTLSFYGYPGTGNGDRGG